MTLSKNLKSTREKKWLQSWVFFILILFFILSAGCSKIVGTANAASHATNTVNQYANDKSQNSIPIIEEIQFLDYNQIYSYLLAGDMGYLFTIQITTDGSPVDVLIMDQDNYVTYKNAFKERIPFSFNAIIHKNIVSDTFYYSLPAQGKYYLVIENARFINGGADAKQTVKYNLKMVLNKG